jgi:hypothetical protein
MHRSYHQSPCGAVTCPAQWCALEVGDSGETPASKGETN